MNCLQEIAFRFKDTVWLKVIGWKEICQPNSSKKRPETTIVISQRIEFKIENVAKEKEMKYYNYLKLNPSRRSKTYNDLHIYVSISQNW